MPGFHGPFTEKMTKPAPHSRSAQGRLLGSLILGVRMTGEIDARTHHTPKAVRVKSIERLFCPAKASRARMRHRSLRLALAKQSFDSFPERSSGLWRAGASDEHGHISAVQNAPG